MCLCRPGLTAAQIRSRVSDAFRVSVDGAGGDLSPSGSGGSIGSGGPFGGALSSTLGSNLTTPQLVSRLVVELVL